MVTTPRIVASGGVLALDQRGVSDVFDLSDLGDKLGHFTGENQKLVRSNWSVSGP
jgi:hypothetical protein